MLTANTDTEPLLIHFDLQAERLKNNVESISRAKEAPWNAGRHTHVSCFEGTREQVLLDIEKWIKNQELKTPRIFWLSGLAGIGKSTIARTIAEKAAGDGVLGGSFFFLRNDEKLGNITHLFPSLAYQLAKHHESYLSLIGTAIEKGTDIASMNQETQFQSLILDPIRKSKHQPRLILLVLDALDEASPEKSVSDTLRMLLSIDLHFALRILITSRPEAHLRLGFSDNKLNPHSELILHKIESSVVEGDIRAFLVEGLRSIPEKLGLQDQLPGWPSSEDMEVVIKKAGNLFIFAKTIIRYVSAGRNPDPAKRLKCILDSSGTSASASPYADLDLLYMTILDNAVIDDEGVDEEVVQYIHNILSFIILCRNPLSVRSLARLIGLDPFKVLNSFFHLHSLLLAPDTIDEIPKIYHLSLSDYLTDPLRCINQKFLVDVPVQEELIVCWCLKIIGDSFDEDFDYSLLSDELDYSCQFWSSHLLQATATNIFEHLKVFYLNHFSFWINIMEFLKLKVAAKIAIEDVTTWIVSLYSIIILLY